MQFPRPDLQRRPRPTPDPTGRRLAASRYNPHDAIHAAAFLLCDEGVRRGDLRTAIFAYNYADWYVDDILEQAAKYAEAAAASVGNGDCNAIQALDVISFVAINCACGQRGLPYVWGGSGPDGVFLSECPPLPRSG